jgi:hypothetical protein
MHIVHISMRIMFIHILTNTIITLYILLLGLLYLFISLSILCMLLLLNTCFRVTKHIIHTMMHIMCFPIVLNHITVYAYYYY